MAKPVYRNGSQCLTKRRRSVKRRENSVPLYASVSLSLKKSIFCRCVSQISMTNHREKYRRNVKIEEKHRRISEENESDAYISKAQNGMAWRREEERRPERNTKLALKMAAHCGENAGGCKERKMSIMSEKMKWKYSMTRGIWKLKILNEKRRRRATYSWRQWHAKAGENGAQLRRKHSCWRQRISWRVYRRQLQLMSPGWKRSRSAGSYHRLPKAGAAWPAINLAESGGYSSSQLCWGSYERKPRENGKANRYQYLKWRSYPVKKRNRNLACNIWNGLHQWKKAISLQKLMFGVSAATMKEKSSAENVSAWNITKAEESWNSVISIEMT